MALIAMTWPFADESNEEEKTKYCIQTMIRSSLILCLLYNSKEIFVIRQSGMKLRKATICRPLFAGKDIENDHHLVGNLNAFAISLSWSDHSWQFKFLENLELAIMNTIHHNKSQPIESNRTGTNNRTNKRRGTWAELNYFCHIYHVTSVCCVFVIRLRLCKVPGELRRNRKLFRKSDRVFIRSA